MPRLNNNSKTAKVIAIIVGAAIAFYGSRYWAKQAHYAEIGKDPERYLEEIVKNARKIPKHLVTQVRVPMEYPLHYAAAHNDLKEVKTLVNSGYDINEKVGYDHYTPIVSAVRYGATDAIDFFIEKGAVIPDNLALEVFAAEATAQTVDTKINSLEALVKHKIDFTVTDKDEQSVVSYIIGVICLKHPTNNVQIDRLYSIISRSNYKPTTVDAELSKEFVKRIDRYKQHPNFYCMQKSHELINNK